MATDGYLYVLSNNSMPNIFKIGKTRQKAASRAHELSKHTAIPTPFKLEYERFFQHAEHAEMLIHALLADHRIDVMREFFAVRIDHAIALCERIAEQLKENPDIFALRFPNHGDSWTQPDIERLRRLIVDGATIRECSIELGRNPYEIETVANKKSIISTTNFPSSVPGFSVLRQPSLQTESISLPLAANRLATYSYTEIRTKYANAYNKWTIEDDSELKERFQKGQDIKALATHFERQPGAIRSRLRKLGLM